jgi:hypothetical protein
MKILAAALVLAIVASACRQAETPARPSQSAAVAPLPREVPSPSQRLAPPAGEPIPAAPAAVPSHAGTLTGSVVETFNAAGYTYIRLNTGRGEEWVAVRQAVVSKGQRVTVAPQMVAHDFESKTLGRRFDTILFGSLAMSSSGQPADRAALASLASEHIRAGMANAPPVRVDRAGGPDARTISEIWAQRSALNGKNVVVRARVVKFLPGIMGTNWIHLRDGSGVSSAGTDDLTVTTSAVAAVGDIVTIGGELHVDRDFGAGYRYGVIVENAAIGR